MSLNFLIALKKSSMDKLFRNKENLKLCTAMVVDSVHEAIAILNKDLQVLSANKAFYSMFKTTNSENEKRNLFDFQYISWESPELKKLFDEVFKNVIVENYEVVQPGPDTEKRLLFSAKMINVPDEEPLILLVIEDISEKYTSEEVLQNDNTELKRACYDIEQKNIQLETKIRSANNKLQRFVNANIMGVLIGTIEGKVTDCNDYCLKILGFSHEDVKGGKINWKALSPPEYQYKDSIAYKELNVKGACDSYEKELFRKDGSRIWVTISATTITNTDIAVFILDISDRKRVEKQLRDERNFISAILSTQGAIVALADASGDIVDLNPAFMKITGYTLEEMKGKSFWQIFPEKDFSKTIHQYDTGNKNNEPVALEYWIQNKKGEKHFIRWRITALRDDNKNITHLIATGIDITDRLEAENRIKKLNDDLRLHASELEIVNSELETFSYSVSHDLKSPLNVISGFSQLIIDQYGSQLDTELVSYLFRIQFSAKKMNTLISDLLTLSKISRTDLIIENINLSEMVSSFLSDLQSSEPERRAAFHVQKGVKVQADERLLHLAIENLLSNAWKYCSKEDKTEIQFGSVVKDGSVVFFIRDNGVGFDMKYAERVFQPFQRLHSEKDFKGTGIGLATVVRVLRRHNGQVWAEAEVGKGATFYFTIGTKI